MSLAPDALSKLSDLVGPSNVLTETEDLIPYSFDGTAAVRQMPGCVVLVVASDCEKARVAHRHVRPYG